jgi:hypothetical protein
MHPEDICQKCGGDNIVWFAPNDLWNKHRGEFNILCPMCFIALCEAGGVDAIWSVRPKL